MYTIYSVKSFYMANKSTISAYILITLTLLFPSSFTTNFSPILKIIFISISLESIFAASIELFYCLQFSIFSKRSF